MDKKSALKEFSLPYLTGRKKFIEKLYKDGYVICSPEDMKKIDGMTVLAEVHGMNPFNPNHVVKEKEE